MVGGVAHGTEVADLCCCMQRFGGGIRSVGCVDREEEGVLLGAVLRRGPALRGEGLICNS